MLGTHVRAVESRVADRRFQDAVGRTACGQRLGRKRVAALADRGSPERPLVELDFGCEGSERPHRLPGHLWTDSVARKDDYPHAATPTRSRRASASGSTSIGASFPETGSGVFNPSPVTSRTTRSDS